MASSRHKRARRRSISPRVARIALPGAVIASIATTAVVWPDPEPASVNLGTSSPLAGLDREQRTSRDGSAARPPVTTRPTPKVVAKPKPKATTPVPTTKKPTPTPTPTPTKTTPTTPKIVDSKYVTTALNVRTRPDTDGSLLTTLALGTKVSVTGEVEGDWAEIVRDAKAYWVKAEYLADKKPVAETTETEPANGDGISGAPCPSGSSVEDGLTADTIRVHRAVCARFPAVSSYGGVRGDGMHSQGRAIDIMLSSSSLGDEIAAWVRANASELGVSEVIWSQRIWTVQRGSEGWRPMEDRGSATANHYDHVHVTT